MQNEIAALFTVAMMKWQIASKLYVHGGPIGRLRNEFKFCIGYYLDKWHTLRLGAKIGADMRGVWCTLMAKSAMVGLNKIWTDRGITKATKKRLVSALIFPIATYRCESWTLTKADQSRITSFEMWCWWRMLRISWYMKRSNISVLEEIQPKRRLLSHVQSQMMKYFGHITRRGGNSLEKVIMQGCVEGRRKPGRPRTRWIDQIKSMVGCPLHELYNLVQDRQRWCDVVAVASCQSWQDRTDRWV